jgi:hypothetical protein
MMIPGKSDSAEAAGTGLMLINRYQVHTKYYYKITHIHEVPDPVLSPSTLR